MQKLIALRGKVVDGSIHLIDKLEDHYKGKKLVSQIEKDLFRKQLSLVEDDWHLKG